MKTFQLYTEFIKLSLYILGIAQTKYYFNMHHYVN